MGSDLIPSPSRRRSIRPAKTLAVLALAAAGGACQSEPSFVVIEPPLPDSADAHHPTCLQGCAVAPPDAPADDVVAEWLQALQAAPVAAASPAIDALLFHRDATQRYLRAHPDLLATPHGQHLGGELRRTEAIVEMRVVDEKGRVRARLPPRRVPLGQKRHIAFADYQELQPFEASGTVVRVGLGHIWTRY